MYYIVHIKRNKPKHHLTKSLKRFNSKFTILYVSLLKKLTLTYTYNKYTIIIVFDFIFTTTHYN